MTDNWEVFEQDLYDILNSQEPKRKGIYLKNFHNDIRSFKSLLFICGSVFLILIGLYSKEYIFSIFGVIVASVYLYMFFNITSSYINSSIIIGKIVDAGKTHPLVEEQSVSEAEISDGKTIPVTFNKYPTVELIENNGIAHAKILYSPKAEYSIVLAVK